MNLSVVIPNYNGEKILSKNLPIILDEINNYKDGKTEVIIVDDASKDNSTGLINKFPQVALLVNPKNLGFSKSVNKGVAYARGDIIILLNTDVKPDKNFLAPLLVHFKDENIFAVGCMDKSIEGEKVVLRGRGVGIWKRGLLIHQRGEINASDTLWVSAGSGAFRKITWDKLGGLNELYSPFYWEDIDLSYRAQKSGYDLVFESKSTVLHEHDKGVIKREFSSFDVKVIVYRNQFIFVWTNLTDFDLVLKHLAWFPYHIVKAILNKDTAFILGLFKALSLGPQIIKSRKDNKKLFVKKDIEITKNFIQ